MTPAHSFKQENGRYSIRPTSYECYGVSFKTQAEADHVAKALNKAFKLGQEDVRSSLRELIGAVRKEDLE